MRSHEIDYEVFGDDLQFVEIELDPNETVIGEAGTMLMMADGIGFETRMGDGTEPDSGMMGKLLGAGKRMISGESLFVTHFTNHGAGTAKVSFAAPYPGKIVPVDLGAIGKRLIAQKDAFLCAAFGTRVDIAFNRKLGAGLFGGEGLFLATIRGTGRVWIQSLPFSRLISRIAASARTGRGNDEASPIGRLANVFENFS